MIMETHSLINNYIKVYFFVETKLELWKYFCLLCSTNDAKFISNFHLLGLGSALIMSRDQFCVLALNTSRIFIKICISKTTRTTAFTPIVLWKMVNCDRTEEVLMFCCSLCTLEANSRSRSQVNLCEMVAHATKSEIVIIYWISFW